MLKFYTAKGAAEHLGISTTTFWRMRKEFPLRSVKAYRAERYEESELEAWFRDPNKVSSYRGQ